MLVSKKFSLIGLAIFFNALWAMAIIDNAHGRSKTESDSRPPAKHFAEIKLPRGYRPSPAHVLQLIGTHINVDLYAATFAQGMAVYAELYWNQAMPEKKMAVERLDFDGRDILLSKREWGYRALFGIHAETAPGMRSLRVAYSIDGHQVTDTFTVRVSRSEYRFPRGALDLGKYSDVDYRPTPEELAFINRCAAKKNMVFKRIGPDLLGESFSHPRDRHHITSSFWAKRLIMQYRKKNGKKIRLKNKLNVHRGVDLRGKTGEPVFSIGGGTVVIAEPMYYEGNFIVIDHGNRIFTYYMHLHSFSVKEGDIVKAGQTVGTVGSTGLSTAAHLHVSLVLQDINVDPLSIIMLPVRR
ncbi:MAG: M23 family metallopeptidase [Spirochaetes bacterium]|nr:M23 family metallopeptidase [Spirochaetota bacterium]